MKNVYFIVWIKWYVNYISVNLLCKEPKAYAKMLLMENICNVKIYAITKIRT